MKAKPAKVKTTMKQIGTVAVDSGQLLIVDPCRAVENRVTDPQQVERMLNYVVRHARGLPDDAPDPVSGELAAAYVKVNGGAVNASCDLATYEEMCGITGQARKVINEDGTEDDWKTGIAGVISGTAYGDDLYPVFQVFEDDQLVGLFVELDGLCHGSGGDGMGIMILEARRNKKGTS